MSKFPKSNQTTEKSGKSINDAVASALSELGVSRDEVDIEVIDEGAKGFLGIGARDARVRVTVKEQTPADNGAVNRAADNKAVFEEKPLTQPKKEESHPEPVIEPVAETKTVSETEDNNVSEAAELSYGGDACEDAKTFLDGVFGAMNLDVNINVSLDGDNMLISLDGDNMGIVIGKRGDTLDSLQYLTSLVVNRRTEDYIKVTIDTENYREKRAQALIALSDRLSEKVARTGKKFTLEPMNPYERRIIHSNLQSSETVTTFSVGTEPYRKVVIAPKNRPQRNRYEKRNKSLGGKKPQQKRENTENIKVEKTGSYKTTYKADFKATPHKAEYKTYAEYLAAQNGEIIPLMNKSED